MPVLREAIARHQRRFWGVEVDPDREVLVTAGATEALAATLLAFVDRGDEVVTLEPGYDSYGAIIALAGGRHVPVPLRAPHFQPDADEFRAAVTDRTRVILLNTPHNPTGAMLEPAFLDLAIELAHRHDAIVVTDEVYEHLVFDGRTHTPSAARPGASGRVVSISSAGKTFSTTGWKIGWLTAAPELRDAVLAVKQFLSYVNGAPFQPAIALGLDLPDTFYASTAATLQHKRDLLIDGLRAAGFGVSRPAGSYFVIADAAPLGHADAGAFCRRLPELAGVVGIPLTAFVHPDRRAPYASLVRFAFCKRVEVIEEATRRLGTMRG
ncbi:aminotransferase [Homoserinibacter gongjuensis]|uniref:Aminotransferase n=1 Tax=Homoserinibacter gongjuensis TaxID=1162968 RepID=A0ABQ6JUM4_9MICO|nr:aminotransferase [Homoserinibacter gongjuensis]